MSGGFTCAFFDDLSSCLPTYSAVTFHLRVSALVWQCLAGHFKTPCRCTASIRAVGSESTICLRFFRTTSPPSLLAGFLSTALSLSLRIVKMAAGNIFRDVTSCFLPGNPTPLRRLASEQPLGRSGDSRGFPSSSGRPLRRTSSVSRLFCLALSGRSAKGPRRHRGRQAEDTPLT